MGSVIHKNGEEDDEEEETNILLNLPKQTNGGRNMVKIPKSNERSRHSKGLSWSAADCNESLGWVGDGYQGLPFD